MLLHIPDEILVPIRSAIMYQAGTLFYSNPDWVLGGFAFQPSSPFHFRTECMAWIAGGNRVLLVREHRA